MTTLQDEDAAISATTDGLSVAQAIAAIVLGTVLGSATQAALSARGPRYGVPQMILPD